MTTHALSHDYSPLDDIIDQLGGPECVAEMTGRRGRMVRSGRGGKVHYELRDSGGNSLESLNNREVSSLATPLQLYGFLLKFLFT